MVNIELYTTILLVSIVLLRLCFTGIYITLSPDKLHLILLAVLSSLPCIYLIVKRSKNSKDISYKVTTAILILAGISYLFINFLLLPFVIAIVNSSEGTNKDKNTINIISAITFLFCLLISIGSFIIASKR